MREVTNSACLETKLSVKSDTAMEPVCLARFSLLYIEL